MNLEYYVIRGRGADGQKFQLAKLEDNSGNNYKGLYDMSRHFSSVDELKSYIADEVIKKPLAELNINAMTI